MTKQNMHKIKRKQQFENNKANITKMTIELQENEKKSQSYLQGVYKQNHCFQAIKQMVDSNNMDINQANEILLEQKRKENSSLITSLRSNSKDFKLLFNKLKLRNSRHPSP